MCCRLMAVKRKKWREHFFTTGGHRLGGVSILEPTSQDVLARASVDYEGWGRRIVLTCPKSLLCVHDLTDVFKGTKNDVRKL